MRQKPPPFISTLILNYSQEKVGKKFIFILSPGKKLGKKHGGFKKIKLKKKLFLFYPREKSWGKNMGDFKKN